MLRPLTLRADKLLYGFERRAELDSYRIRTSESAGT